MHSCLGSTITNYNNFIGPLLKVGMVLRRVDKGLFFTMTLERIIKIIKSRTKGIYLETFYKEIAKEILGHPIKIRTGIIPEINDYFNKLEEGKYYTTEFNKLFRESIVNNNISDKKIFILLKEHFELSSSIIQKGKDHKGRYFILNQWKVS